MAESADWQAALQRLVTATGARLAQGMGGPVMETPQALALAPRLPRGGLPRWVFALTPPERFLRQAYLWVLGREPDPSGVATYTPWLGEWLGRVAVLAALAQSEEGRGKGAAVLGVGPWAWLWHGLRRTGWRRAAGPISAWLWRRDVARALIWQGQQMEMRWGMLLDWSQAWQGWGERLQGHLSEGLGEVRERLGRLDEALAALRVSVTQMAEAVGRVAGTCTAEVTGAEAQTGLQGPLGAFYRDFEGAFREGESVKERLQVYLPYVAPYLGELVVDLGCGRGDWLALALGHGHRVLGIEPCAELASLALEQGVPVVSMDGLAWLRAQPEGSAGVISALHVLEHLPFAVVLAWLQESFRVLRRGGLALFETPNPENGYVSTYTFFHDPTHLRPLTPELMRFALDWVGFERIEVLRLHPLPGRLEARDPAAERLNGWLHGPQDFCILGYKP